MIRSLYSAEVSYLKKVHLMSSNAQAEYLRECKESGKMSNNVKSTVVSIQSSICVLNKMSLVLTRNQSLLHSWRHLRRVEPESGPQWEKSYMHKVARSPKLYGWYHNWPYAQWNNLAWFQGKSVLRDTVASEVFKYSDLSRFAELLKMAETSVLHELSTTGPWTVFAPKNCAFDKVRGGWPAFLEKVIQDPLALRRFLRAHATRGRFGIRGLSWKEDRRPHRMKKDTCTKLSNLEGSGLKLSISGSFEMNNRKVLLALASDPENKVIVNEYDRRTHNGYLHLMDGLLMPSKTK